MAAKPKLTPEQSARLADMVLRENKSYSDIAKEFGVSDDTIYRKAMKLGIHASRQKQGEYYATVQKKSGSEKDKILSRREELKNEFIKTDRYKKIAEIYDKVSLRSFLEQWTDWHIQLKDVTPSEEDAIELAIMVKLRLQDNQEKYSRYNQMLKELNAELESLDMTIDESDEQQRILHQKLESADLIQIELNKDIKDLTDKFNNLQKLLNASREQREKTQKIGGDTFASLVIMMTDRARRAEVADDEELWRIATENKIAKMKQNIEFEDGTVEPIIMDGSDYLDKAVPKEVISGQINADKTENSDEETSEGA